MRWLLVCAATLCGVSAARACPNIDTQQTEPRSDFHVTTQLAFCDAPFADLVRHARLTDALSDNPPPECRRRIESALRLRHEVGYDESDVPAATTCEGALLSFSGSAESRRQVDSLCVRKPPNGVCESTRAAIERVRRGFAGEVNLAGVFALLWSVNEQQTLPCRHLVETLANRLGYRDRQLRLLLQVQHPRAFDLVRTAEAAIRVHELGLAQRVLRRVVVGRLLGAERAFYHETRARLAALNQDYATATRAIRDALTALGPNEDTSVDHLPSRDELLARGARFAALAGSVQTASRWFSGALQTSSPRRADELAEAAIPLSHLSGVRTDPLADVLRWVERTQPRIDDRRHGDLAVLQRGWSATMGAVGARYWERGASGRAIEAWQASLRCWENAIGRGSRDLRGALARRLDEVRETLDSIYAAAAQSQTSEVVDLAIAASLAFTGRGLSPSVRSFKPGSREELIAAALSGSDVGLDFHVVDIEGVNHYVVFVFEESSVDVVTLARRYEIDLASDALLAALRSPRGSYRRAVASIRAALAPIWSRLRGNVRVSLQGRLSLVPLEVLWNGRAPEITYSLGLAKSEPMSLGRDARAAVVGDPRVADFSPLPGARREARMVSRRFRGTTLLDTRATESAVRELLRRNHSLVHIAAHGVYAPLQSSIPVAEPHLVLRPTSEHDGRLTAAEIAVEVDLAGRPLVVLSACDSGDGAVRPGQGISGLQHALLRAGAGGVVMTRWAVNDDATANFMHIFYRYLARGVSAEESLRVSTRLQRERYSHPHYWAPFLMLAAD